MLPRPKLDAQADSPLYRQLFEHIKGFIQSGTLGPGEKLPATRELAGLLGLNRTTVSAAYALLEEEGLLKGHVGRGSFVDGGSIPVTATTSTSSLNWDELLKPADGILAELAPPLPISGNVISFATSRPPEELFPLEEFRVICRDVIAGKEARAILQLGSPSGYGPLRRYLSENARVEGVLRPSDDIVITNGCQQALDLIQRVLAPAGETVLLEDPVYPGLKNVFARAGARIIGLPVAADGIQIEQLERVLAKERPRLLVLTPNFQNPTGSTLPLAARQEILRIARTAQVVVVENDIYGDLRYEGTHLPSLKQLDETGDTILLRSFSKVAFPGLRVGWVIAPRALTARMAEAKQWCDLHTDQLSQAVLLRFAESGELQSHRTKMLAAGAERLSAVLASCELSLPAGRTFTRPQGGMNLWVRLPEPLDAGELLTRAQTEGASYLPGKYFAISRFDPGSLRLSFAGLAPEKIRHGLAILGEVFSSELNRVRASRMFEPALAMV